MARPGDQDFLAWLKERVQAIPGVGDDRYAARGGLKETDAGRVAGTNHVGASDVEGEVLPVVESAMLGWGEMVDALDVGRPLNGSRILRAGDDELCFGFTNRGFEH